MISIHLIRICTRCKQAKKPKTVETKRNQSQKTLDCESEEIWTIKKKQTVNFVQSTIRKQQVSNTLNHFDKITSIWHSAQRKQKGNSCSFKSQKDLKNYLKRIVTARYDLKISLTIDIYAFLSAVWITIKNIEMIQFY